MSLQRQRILGLDAAGRRVDSRPYGHKTDKREEVIEHPTMRLQGKRGSGLETAPPTTQTLVQFVECTIADEICAVRRAKCTGKPLEHGDPFYRWKLPELS